MNRRSFFQKGLAAIVLAKFSANNLFAKQRNTAPTQETKINVTCENVAANPEDVKVRFLGTGAAGWQPGAMRRNSSALFDDEVLIDFTVSVEDKLPSDAKPKCLFYTHSHGDHYQPERALRLGLKRIYFSESWAERAKRDFEMASAKTGFPVPELIPLKMGETVSECGLKITPLPANHATSDMNERSCVYLIEKNVADKELGVRILYATDTGGITGLTGKMSGIDSHVANGRAITGLIMEATMGYNHDEDFRIFNHSSARLVHRTVNMLTATKRYLPPEGQPVYLTHMAPSLHDNLDQESLNESLPNPLRAAYDGLEVVFRPVE